MTRSEAVATAHGTVRGAEHEGIRVFKGIRYGASTEGANRFRPPQPPPTWTGELDALAYGDSAPQTFTRLALGGTKGNRPPLGEDCLRLNVWTPGCDDARRPVMVWLHGGGFEAGTGSMLLYDGTNVARRGDVVVVTINHRLNVFGHCYLDDVGGDDLAGSANVGFLDVVAALEWVAENVAGFGGDPGNVTIYGQSGGGRKVSIAMAAPAAQGLFHRGIVQSGSHLRLHDPDRAAGLTGRLFDELGLRAGDVRALQEVSTDRLVDAQATVRGRFSPTLDGVVFDRHPWDPDAPSLSAHIPLMVGTCRTELSNQVGTMDPTTFDITDDDLAERLARYVPADDVAELVDVVRRTNPGASAPEVFFTLVTARGYWLDSVLQTERKAEQGAAPVYSYRLMWRTPVEGGRRITPHSLDLPFVFDNVAVAPDMVGDPTEETAALAHAMSESWIAFAHTGDPNNGAVPPWAPYDLDRRTVMHFDVPPAVVDDPHRDERLAMSRYETQQAAGRALHR
ncbi:carboxylesterase/lipase family protein [Actinomarinicola tropica]|nr:carboxylesterase/lipase family protein [Actinomarinicola tropica]